MSQQLRSYFSLLIIVIIASIADASSGMPVKVACTCVDPALPCKAASDLKCVSKVNGICQMNGTDYSKDAACIDHIKNYVSPSNTMVCTVNASYAGVLTPSVSECKARCLVPFYSTPPECSNSPNKNPLPDKIACNCIETKNSGCTADFQYLSTAGEYKDQVCFKTMELATSGIGECGQFCKIKAALLVPSCEQGSTTPTPMCQPAVGAGMPGSLVQNTNCAGSWSMCTRQCEAASDRTWTQTTAQSGTGSACPAAESCKAGQGTCLADVNCAGSWSTCTSQCETASRRTWKETTAKSGKGSACPTAESCRAGQGTCPADVNCAGTWSTCTSQCETATMRTWTQTTAKSGNGSACPKPESCKAGQGQCTTGSTSSSVNPSSSCTGAKSAELTCNGLEQDFYVTHSPTGVYQDFVFNKQSNANLKTGTCKFKQPSQIYQNKVPIPELLNLADQAVTASDLHLESKYTASFSEKYYAAPCVDSELTWRMHSVDATLAKKFPMKLKIRVKSKSTDSPDTPVVVSTVLINLYLCTPYRLSFANTIPTTYEVSGSSTLQLGAPSSLPNCTLAFKSKNEMMTLGYNYFIYEVTMDKMQLPSNGVSIKIESGNIYFNGYPTTWAGTTKALTIKIWAKENPGLILVNHTIQVSFTGGTTTNVVGTVTAGVKTTTTSNNPYSRTNSVNSPTTDPKTAHKKASHFPAFLRPLSTKSSPTPFANGKGSGPKTFGGSPNGMKMSDPRSRGRGRQGGIQKPKTYGGSSSGMMNVEASKNGTAEIAGEDGGNSTNTLDETNEDGSVASGEDCPPCENEGEGQDNEPSQGQHRGRGPGPQKGGPRGMPRQKGVAPVMPSNRGRGLQQGGRGPAPRMPARGNSGPRSKGPKPSGKGNGGNCDCTGRGRGNRGHDMDFDDHKNPNRTTPLEAEDQVETEGIVDEVAAETEPEPEKTAEETAVEEAAFVLKVKQNSIADAKLTLGFEVSDEFALKIAAAKAKENTVTVEKVKLAPLSATVEKITTDGVLTMSFSRDIHLEKGIPLPGPETIGVSMGAASSGKGRRLGADDDQEDDSFSWKTKSLTSRALSVQMTFSDPLAVSSDASEPALLQFEVKNKYYFMTEGDFTPLDTNIEIKAHPIPKQFPDKESAASIKANAKKAQAVMMGQLIMTICLQLVFSKILKKMWPLFNTIQLVLMIKYMKLSIPANASGFFDKIEDTIELNAIPKEEIKNYVINHPLVNEMADGGGILIVISIPLMLLFMILLAVCACAARTSVKIQGYYQKMKQLILYNTLIRVFITSYIGLALLVFHDKIEDEDKDSMTKLKKKLPFIVICAACPTFCFWFAWFTEPVWLELPTSRKDWGTMYESIDTNRWSSMSLYGVFFTRRAVFMWILFYLREYLFVQWFLLTFLSIAQLSYYLHTKPYIEKPQNNLEVMNELCLLFSLYFICLFSDFVTKAKDQYSFGFYFVGVQGVMLLVNQAEVLRTLINMCKLKFKKRAFLKKAKEEAEVKAKLKDINGEEDEVDEQVLPTLQMKREEARQRNIAIICNRQSGLPTVLERNSEDEASEPSEVTPKNPTASYLSHLQSNLKSRYDEKFKKQVEEENPMDVVEAEIRTNKLEAILYPDQSKPKRTEDESRDRLNKFVAGIKAIQLRKQRDPEVAMQEMMAKMKTPTRLQDNAAKDELV